jgi:hypothetical protein
MCVCAVVFHSWGFSRRALLYRARAAKPSLCCHGGIFTGGNTLSNIVTGVLCFFLLLCAPYTRLATKHAAESELDSQRRMMNILFAFEVVRCASLFFTARIASYRGFNSVGYASLSRWSLHNVFFSFILFSSFYCCNFVKLHQHLIFLISSKYDI